MARCIDGGAAARSRGDPRATGRPELDGPLRGAASDLRPPDAARRSDSDNGRERRWRAGRGARVGERGKKTALTPAAEGAPHGARRRARTPPAAHACRGGHTAGDSLPPPLTAAWPGRGRRSGGGSLAPGRPPQDPSAGRSCRGRRPPPPPPLGQAEAHGDRAARRPRLARGTRAALQRRTAAALGAGRGGPSPPLTGDAEGWHGRGETDAEALPPPPPPSRRGGAAGTRGRRGRGAAEGRRGWGDEDGRCGRGGRRGGGSASIFWRDRRERAGIGRGGGVGGAVALQRVEAFSPAASDLRAPNLHR
ncbi:hypothetical protein PVAP13_6NG090712 [Panicum virgatum]|uniref:Uncharacterized protein n=1 Tax=Panicum virgatum TaxID=38727 RepID=A0A8T0QWP4_PANVG|nr:hypothetical protein PVAP13_6NG090712 [Panicum virgatum]